MLLFYIVLLTNLVYYKRLVGDVIVNESFKYLDDLLNKDDVIILGCSGGPDSMALMHMLLSFRDSKNINIVCAHVNHKVRLESDEEMHWMERFCSSHNIIFESMCINNYGDDNFENEARNIRYKFFEELVKKYGAKYLMTAHHGDDLMETILMKIVRGSSLSGYAGFKTVVDKKFYKIVRPLIFVTKDQILEYNKNHNIEYVIDETNFLDIHTRNRYRKVVLPFLKKEDPLVHKKFYKYSKTLLMYDNYINKQIEKINDTLYEDDKLVIDKFLKLDDVIQIKVINLMLEKFYQDDMILINDIHTDLIINLIKSNKSNSCVYLPNNVKAVKNYNYVMIQRETEQIDKYEIEIKDYVSLPNNKIIKIIDYAENNSNNYCRLNSNDITLPLIARTRKSGDKIAVKGLEGTKKVKDIFIDSKVPVQKRDLWPIVVDSKDTIVWIPGLKKSKFDVSKNENCDIILKYY